MKSAAFYTVCILTETGWQYSRSFNTKAAAQKWARWCSERWQAALYKGAPGGERLADFPCKRAA
jgi:hypothetical protein